MRFQKFDRLDQGLNPDRSIHYTRKFLFFCETVIES